MKRIAIIGGGPMGLALAWYLRDAYRCVVFEADDRPGGMSASFDFDGVTIERYYHFINTPDEAFFRLLRELDMEGELRWQPTKMGLFRPDRQGRKRVYEWGTPLALLRLSAVPLVIRLRYGFHAVCCKFLKDLTPLDDVPASRWFSRWEGQKGYELLWRFLFEKKFFELAEPLSAAWIASRIRRVANSRESLLQEKLGYLEGGCASLVSRLITELENSGGELFLQCPISHVDPQPEGGGIVYANGAEESFDAIVFTLPLPYVPRLAPELPAAWINRVKQVRNIGCRCVLFRLAKPLTDNFWLNVDIADWDIPGVIEYSNLRPMEKAHVYVPFYMPHSHPNWTLPDEELVSKARAYLQGINPAAMATEEAVRLFRYEYAQPVCQPGFRHILPPYETGHPGILAADTTHSYPEDRSINESVRIAGELAAVLRANA